MTETSSDAEAAPQIPLSAVIVIRFYFHVSVSTSLFSFSGVSLFLLGQSLTLRLRRKSDIGQSSVLAAAEILKPHKKQKIIYWLVLVIFDYVKLFHKIF